MCFFIIHYKSELGTSFVQEGSTSLLINSVGEWTCDCFQDIYIIAHSRLRSK